MAPLSPAAMRKLQVLYGQLATRSFDVSKAREDRCAWASQQLGRSIATFKDLTAAEGKLLIDRINAQLGVRDTVPARRRPTTRREAIKAGTAGRRDDAFGEVTMLTGSEDIFRLIQREMTKLGMDEKRLHLFLLSRSNPNGGRTTIRTLEDANRVYWALKRIADRQGAAA